MITEDYVSFETAKLLKEKGFDTSEIDAYFPFVYYANGKMDFYNDDDPLFVCEAVTLQMAMKWLREIYDLHIITYPWRANKEERATHWCCQVYKSFNLLGYEKYTNETSKSYEQACEAAIKYCLENLI